MFAARDACLHCFIPPKVKRGHVVLSALNDSIEKAIQDGSLDEVKHGALIEAARKVASFMDSPEWPMVNGRHDNVSPGVFLKYCEALGLTPTESKPMTEKQTAKLVKFSSSSKFAKAANA